MMSAFRVKIIELVNLQQKDAVQKLVSSGQCNIDEQNDAGISAVLCAVLNKNIEILRILIDAGANILVEDNFGRTPLSQAKKLNYTEIADLLEKTIHERENPPSQSPHRE